MEHNKSNHLRRVFSLPVIVAALGYFVDIYDLVLFSIVRVPSLKALGFAVGYWAVFVTVAAEQFGTNLRATVATTVPNFVRGMVVPITLLFKYLRQYLGLTGSAVAVGAICVIAALIALASLKETFHKDLDYFEEFM